MPQGEKFVSFSELKINSFCNLNPSAISRLFFRSPNVELRKKTFSRKINQPEVLREWRNEKESESERGKKVECKNKWFFFERGWRWVDLEAVVEVKGEIVLVAISYDEWIIVVFLSTFFSLSLFFKLLAEGRTKGEYKISEHCTQGGGKRRNEGEKNSLRGWRCKKEKDKKKYEKKRKY